MRLLRLPVADAPYKYGYRAFRSPFDKLRANGPTLPRDFVVA